MGTIAARDCLRVLQLTEQVLAAMLITVRQGVALRERDGGSSVALSAQASGFVAQLGAEIAFIDEDVALEPLLRQLLTRISDQAWSIYD